MQSMMEVCFMCSKDINCVPVDDRIVSQVKYLLPEITIIKLGVPLRICSICEDNLVLFNTFKQIWVKNSNRLEATIKASQNTTTHAHNRSETQTEHNIDDNIEIKEEVFDNNDISDRDKHVEEENTDHDDNTMNVIEFLEIEQNLDIKTDNENDESTSETSDPKFEQVFITENLEQNETSKDLPSTTSESKKFTFSASTDGLIPKKSESKYKKEYQNFCEWCTETNVMDITEETILAYFTIMSETKKASTMWSNYSMLRACLSEYKEIDISKFSKVTSYLKTASENYQPKKSKILDPEDIRKFINDANDNMFLAMKVILIMGYCGVCRRDELTNMRVSDVQIKSNTITVHVPGTKANCTRLFVIKDSSWVALIKKYVELRPSHVTINRFFLTYRNGRCVASPIGIHKIGEVPRNIAKYLKLPNPELYTGHCFRRSSTSRLANQGGDLVTIKTQKGWKSAGVAEGYLDISLPKS